MMMTCNHHPEYDPQVGKPKTFVEVEQDYPDHFLLVKCVPKFKIKDQRFPCPYCWIAYANFLSQGEQ